MEPSGMDYGKANDRANLTDQNALMRMSQNSPTQSTIQVDSVSSAQGCPTVLIA